MDECKALSDGSPRGAFAGHGRCARFVSCYVLDLLDDADIYATLAEAEVGAQGLSDVEEPRLPKFFQTHLDPPFHELHGYL